MMYIPFDFNTKTKPSRIKNSTILCQLLNVPFIVSLLPCCKVLITFVHHSLPFFSPWRRQLLWCDQYWRLAPPSSVPMSTAQTRPVVRSGVSSRVVTTEQGTSPHTSVMQCLDTPGNMAIADVTNVLLSMKCHQICLISHVKSTQELACNLLGTPVISVQTT